jgi:hypothetical protein
MTLDMTKGVPKIVFSRIRESLRDSMINSDFEVAENVNDEIIDSSSSIDFELHRMKRGQSFENERGCDEIMQQFMYGLESFIEPPSY